MLKNNELEDYLNLVNKAQSKSRDKLKFFYGEKQGKRPSISMNGCLRSSSIEHIDNSVKS